ncbi:hypothetical protein [Bordetella sp. LUAb4]|uniref:hypothetical protein n=1 Tax=Bordetella sp. LUAb4 TaxID=2843195 RepID=UPI001E5FF920|nr:hypothetical protein [Bordetella sp. LUAb4]
MPVNAIASPSVVVLQGATPASPADHGITPLLRLSTPATAAAARGSWPLIDTAAPVADFTAAPPRIARSTRVPPVVAVLRNVPRDIRDFSDALKAELDSAVLDLTLDCRALIDITAHSPIAPAAALRAYAIRSYLTGKGIDGARIGTTRGKDRPRFHVSYGSMATGMVRISKIPMDGEPCSATTSAGRECEAWKKSHADENQEKGGSAVRIRRLLDIEHRIA